MFTGVTSLQTKALISCPNLVTLSLPSSCVIIGNTAICDCPITSLDLSNVEKILVHGVTRVNIRSVYAPKLKSIGAGLFNQCPELESIDDLGLITEIPGGLNYALMDFGNNPKLKKVNLPDSLIAIGAPVLGGCNSLEILKIGNSISSIGRLCCYINQGTTAVHLDVIIYAVTPPTISDFLFRRTDFFIYVPDESVTTYQEATNWSAFSDRIKPLSEYSE